MVVLPLIKLGTLAVKTFCKPIANTLEKEASYHPLFRKFIINITQANYRVATDVQRRIYGRTTNVAIRPLDEEKAIKAAATLLGEIFMFTVAGAAVIYEVQNSIRESRMKEERHRQESQAIKAELASAIENIGKQVELHAGKQVDHIKQVEQLVQKQAERAQQLVAELSQKQEQLAAERAQQLVAELSQKQEQLAAEHAQKQEQLAAELAQKQEQLAAGLAQKQERLAAGLAQKQELLAAKLAQQFAAELAQKHEQLAARLAQKQEQLAAELAAKLAAEFKEKRQVDTFFVIFDAHSCQ